MTAQLTTYNMHTIWIYQNELSSYTQLGIKEKLHFHNNYYTNV